MQSGRLEVFHRYLVWAMLVAVLLVGGILFFPQVRDWVMRFGPQPPPPVIDLRTPPGINVTEIVIRYPGASAEEVERRIVIPMEANLAGTPGLEAVSSRSIPGCAHVSLRFKKGGDGPSSGGVSKRLRTERWLPVGGRLEFRLPASGVVLRYLLRGPKDAGGRDVYSPSDLWALQERLLETEFRTSVSDVRGGGGWVKRYEVHPDADRLRRYGIPLVKLQLALTKPDGVREVELFGGPMDPVPAACYSRDAPAAAAVLRSAEARRVRELRDVVVATVNSQPVHVGDLVEGGRLAEGDVPGRRGVVVRRAPRRDQVCLSRRQVDGDGRVSWTDEDDRVQGALLLRAVVDARAGLDQVLAQVRKLNDTPHRLLPGVRIEPYAEPPELGGRPEAGDGPLWAYGTFPANVSFDEAARAARTARDVLKGYPETEAVVSRLGGSDDGADPVAPDMARFCVMLRPGKDWPTPPGHVRPRTLPELMRAMEAELKGKLAGVDWGVTRDPPEALPEPFRAAPGEQVVKIFGPDLGRLEQLASRVRQTLLQVPGVDHVRVLPLKGRPVLDFRIDPEKCAKWGVAVANVQRAILASHDRLIATPGPEGRVPVGVLVGWPGRRDVETSILDMPVDHVNNQVVAPGDDPRRAAPRLRLRDLVSPVDDKGRLDPQGAFLSPGTAAIYRENGKRLIAVLFRVSDRDPAAAVAEAARRTEGLFQEPYRAAWGGK
jgi:Cu/Ag efflux pump CusA